MLALCALARPLGAVRATQPEQRLDAGEQCVSSGSAAQVRSGPGTEYPQVGSLATGTAVNVAESASGWYRLAQDSAAQGWAAARLFAPCDPTASPMPGGKSEGDMRSELAAAGYPFAGTASVEEVQRVYAQTAVDYAGGAPAALSGSGYQPADGPLFTRWSAQVSPTNSLPEYPRPQLARTQWLSLNGMWEFQQAQAGEGPPVGRALAEDILVPFPIESALSGVMRHIDRAWYRRVFETPLIWAGQRVLLHFGAVDWEASVFVNGQPLGIHQGGYDSFNFDITDVLRPVGPQEIVVGVFDPTDSGEQPRGKQVHEPGDIWYTASTGIWQTVWLEPVPATRVEGLRITPDVDRGSVHVEVDVSGAAPAWAQVQVTAGGRAVAVQSGSTGGVFFLPIPNAILWSPGNPHLYDLEVKLLGNGAVIDKVSSYFGMRKISTAPVGGVPRVHLNGQPLFQVGALDQGYWPDGLYTAPADEALRYDVETARALGFNLIRKHMKVEPARWYYWADRLGMLVWQDMPMGNNWSEWGRAHYRDELGRMLAQLHNHPSVITWVLFNERWGEFDVANMAATVKSLDPTRLVIGASGYADQGVGDAISFHSYERVEFPAVGNGGARVLAEWGGLGWPLSAHLWATDNLRWSEPTYLESESSAAALLARYTEYAYQIRALRDNVGLSAAVYSQLTDVERETTGWITYDRAVTKAAPEQVRAIHNLLH
jgi:hypothetical protein